MYKPEMNPYDMSLDISVSQKKKKKIKLLLNGVVKLSKWCRKMIYLLEYDIV